MVDDLCWSYGASELANLDLLAGLLSDHPVANRIGSRNLLTLLAVKPSLAYTDVFSKSEQANLRVVAIKIDRLGLFHHRFDGPTGSRLRILPCNNPPK